jgi:uncharacterized protein YgbK (DUF1537 family)
MGEGFPGKRAAANHMVDIATGAETQMTKIDIETLAENIFSNVNMYVNRYMADMRKYVDGQIETVKAHHKEENTPASAGAGTLAELSQTVRGLERRAGRHAEHLLKLESRIHTLEGKKE